MLLFLFTAAVWWLADLFTLVIRGERLRGRSGRGGGMFGWLVESLREGGIFLCLFFSIFFYLEKRGVFIAFRAAQPHTVEHSNAQSCTVDAQ